MGRADEENAAVGKIVDVVREADAEGGDFRRMKVEGEEVSFVFDDEEDKIGAGGERTVEMTVGEFGGRN